MYMLILLTCLALAFGLPMIPNPRYTFHDREVKTEQVERKEDEESYEESEQRE